MGFRRSEVRLPPPIPAASGETQDLQARFSFQQIRPLQRPIRELDRSVVPERLREVFQGRHQERKGGTGATSPPERTAIAKRLPEVPHRTPLMSPPGIMMIPPGTR